MAATLLSADSIDIKRRRLEQLQRQAAAFGLDCPPHITMEIRDLQREIAAAAPATVAESHDILYDMLLRLEGRLDRLYWFVALMALIIIMAVKL
jgi:hypothetical protein